MAGAIANLNACWQAIQQVHNIVSQFFLYRDTLLGFRMKIVSKIDRLPVLMSIGIHPWEKHKERPNLIEVTVELSAEVSIEELKKGFFIDYDPVFQYINNLSRRDQTDFLEEVAIDIMGVCFNKTLAQSVMVQLEKKTILPPSSGVGISINMTRSEWANEHA
jgi:7,8-dihydroneopterin aldolase/epimerase/oxygenase